jgi:hypothetical protein
VRPENSRPWNGGMRFLPNEPSGTSTYIEGDRCSTALITTAVRKKTSTESSGTSFRDPQVKNASSPPPAKNPLVARMK